MPNESVYWISYPSEVREGSAVYKSSNGKQTVVDCGGTLLIIDSATLFVSKRDALTSAARESMNQSNAANRRASAAFDEIAKIDKAIGETG